MKFLIVLASVVLAISAASDRELWQEFKAKHGKTYRSLLEEQARYGIFQSNLRKIEQHNELYEQQEKSYTLGVNQFADLTHEEFKNTILTLKPETTKATEVFAAPAGYAAPSSINWISKGAVTGVKNQGSCGSCWAFSAVGALEGAYFLSKGSLVSFSEQDLVDCSTRYGNGGCDGGSMQAAYDFVRDNGIPTESDYPYTARDDSCQSIAVFTKISKYVSISQSENSLLAAVGSVGPIAVAIDADYFQFYSSGVFDESACTHNLDHGVTVVGYDSQDGKDYWLVKNSWGADWGESGYVKMVRNSNNQCGIADDALYPVL